MMSVSEKFHEIAEDLSHNVTHIYERNDIIKIADLIYHSVLSFNFRGERINKGWCEGVLLGDTRVGKSATMKALVKHYNAGEFITGEDLSKAGLIGGLQQIGNRWMITWGKLPLLSRRIAVLDEVNNIPLETIASMSGMRSSGIAELTKIQSSKTEARTRQLWLGNPRSGEFLKDYSHGIVGIQKLIGNLDDVARFDIGLTCAEEEVTDEVFNESNRKTVEHKYTSEVCHNLVMWAWSRKPEDVVFVEDSDLAILDYAKDIGRRYTSKIPLVNPSEMRLKLAKLSVSTACRVFSTDESKSKVLVKPEHVEFVSDTLHEFYDKPSMGYDIYTRVVTDESAIEDIDGLVNFLKTRGKIFTNGLMGLTYVTHDGLKNLSGVDSDTAKAYLSFLVMNKAVINHAMGYVKSPAFNKLLRDIASGKIDIPEKADNMKDGVMI